MKKSIFFSYSLFFLIITSTAIVFSRGGLKNSDVAYTNQDPQCLIEARKNIIGVWSAEEFPENKWEFKADGVLETILENNGEVSAYSYKIVNTTPICGYDVDVDEEEEYMYLVIKDIKTSRESCSELRFFPGNKRISLWSLGMGANGNSIFNKK